MLSLSGCVSGNRQRPDPRFCGAEEPAKMGLTGRLSKRDPCGSVSKSCTEGDSRPLSHPRCGQRFADTPLITGMQMSAAEVSCETNSVYQQGWDGSWRLRPKPESCHLECAAKHLEIRELSTHAWAEVVLKGTCGATLRLTNSSYRGSIGAWRLGSDRSPSMSRCCERPSSALPDRAEICRRL